MRPAQQLSSDDELLALAVREIGELNARYPAEPDARAALHRAAPRAPLRASPNSAGWAGSASAASSRRCSRELVDGPGGHFFDLGEWSRTAAGTRYLVTLDSDTRLPPGRLRDLVGVAAHPHNQPRLDADGRRVVAGYGILQPRVVTPLPSPADVTLYHWLFGGQRGHRPVQRRDLRGLPGPVRRRHVHRQGPAQRRGGARGARRTPARKPGAQPRPARRRAGALRRGHRHHGDRGGAVPCRCRGLARAPLDPRRLAAAAVPAAAVALPRRRASTAGRCSTTCAARWSRRCRSGCCCSRWRPRCRRRGRCWRWCSRPSPPGR